jgi:hypothetical protein
MSAQKEKAANAAKSVFLANMSHELRYNLYSLSPPALSFLTFFFSTVPRLMELCSLLSSWQAQISVQSTR